MTSKQRAFLKGLAMELTPVLQIGKGGLTPEVTEAVREAMENRVIGKKIVLYKEAKEPEKRKILLPK